VSARETLAAYDLCAVGQAPTKVNNQEAPAAVLCAEDQTRTATAVERREGSLPNRTLQGYRVRRLAWHTPTGSPYPFVKEAQPSLEALNRVSRLGEQQLAPESSFVCKNCKARPRFCGWAACCHQMVC